MISVQLTQLAEKAVVLGAHRAAAVAVKDIVFDAGFRKLCEGNACGNYGKCWMCPPDVGNIHSMIVEAQTFDAAIVYQTIGQLEDSYDFEGMMEAAWRHNLLVQKISAEFPQLPFDEILHLGAGGCRICEKCAKREDLPCRHPNKAMASLETYGIDVSQLAKASGMNYINRQNTVTYFGACFIRL